MKDLEGTLALVLVAMVGNERMIWFEKAAFRPGWLCEWGTATKYLYPLPSPRLSRRGTISVDNLVSISSKDFPPTHTFYAF